MATVLFVCLQNAGRSQMSQALFERTAGSTHRALSAGTTPADHVHPGVVVVMRELGIDLSDRKPQPLTRELAEQANVVVTMGCGDQCPFIPGKRYIDWELPDPHGQPIEVVRHPRRDRQTYEAARSRALSHLASLRDQPDSDRWLRECCAKELAMNVWRPIRSSSLRNDLIGGAHG